MELLYRLLGAVLVARRALVAGTTAVGVVLWLLLLHTAAVQLDAQRALALFALPVLLGAAAWSLFQLPPGVVFRPLWRAPVDVPHPSARCLASGYFECPGRAQWRLLARSSLAIGGDGSLRAVSPPPLLSGPDAVQRAFPGRGRPTAAQLRAGERPRHPEWVYQPETLVGGSSRLLYQSADDYAAAVGTLAIPRTALADLTPGWQYSGLGRWPAIRLLYHGPDGALVAAYLAFADDAQRAWALERLVGRQGPRQGRD